MLPSRRQELRLRVIKAYGGRCACCPEADPAKLNVVMVGGTPSQQAEYRELRKSRSPDAALLFLYNRYYPKTHTLICTPCVQARGGFVHVAKHFDFKPIKRSPSI